MYQRCETYPQHAKLVAVIAGMPKTAWYHTNDAAVHGDDLLKQASTEQLVQALKHEQNHPPESWWKASDHILLQATDKQLTGPVIAQLTWTEYFLGGEAGPHNMTAGRWQHIIGHVQQNLLEGNNNAWNVFCGIVNDGNAIGDTAKIALAVEHQHRPNPKNT